MKKKLMLIFMIALVILIIGCENPWMKDILDKMSKEKDPPRIPGFEWIRHGSFIMGSPAGEPGRDTEEVQHQVRLTKGFYMSKYQVTQEQYQAVMGNNPSNFTTSPEGNRNKLPVEKVSWYDAIVFCNKLSIEERLNPVYTILGTTNPDGWGPVPTSSNPTWDAATANWNANGYRLPTEAEWEYACRAGTTTAYSYGNTANGDYMWYDLNSDSTHEVGKKLPNEWGLYDMHGNVGEWCWDWYEAYGGDDTNPTGPPTGAFRVRRGGSWSLIAQYARSADRANTVPGGRYNYFGCRLVRR
ncbi:MAG: formylglycine-generating enzyme family protein [Spirochaetaceae bacterium]|nr:formylglycine-generating enzyme family protein [Spirochaetaceae bacterium]